MAPYMGAGVSLGGDLGVSYDDVLEILDELGMGLPATKAMRASTVVQQGIRDHAVLAQKSYDGFRMYDMITGYGCAAALDESWRAMGGRRRRTRGDPRFWCSGCFHGQPPRATGVSRSRCR